MKIAIVSPFPPARSGVADYAARIADAISDQVEVPRLSAPGGFDLDTFDAVLYHMGNNPLHGPVYEAALTVPGIVVLHDAVLHHFTLGWLPKQRYVEEFVYNYGQWCRDFAEDLWRTGLSQLSRNATFPIRCCGVWWRAIEPLSFTMAPLAARS